MAKTIGAKHMSNHTAVVRWSRSDQKFTDNQYSRVHEWAFDGGIQLRASSSPHAVRLPFSDPSAVDPEEAFVAAVSSCHMLTFLYLAAKKGFRVDSYVDEAMGVLETIQKGRMGITRVMLHPKIVFSGDKLPSGEEIENLHHHSHEECYIANSVKCEITWSI
jgi:organic hydroperoxide reductase OsmC/OhrA